MIRRLCLSLVAAGALSAPAHAFDLNELSKYLTPENIESATKIINNTVEANQVVGPRQEVIMGQM
ncbi:hypothetical protein [Deefgea sp. CFH1-16]|uniref:hypothetical protein n=1 Tax=Deefgea sp. CFH1-16 TaxID=2675457 RepID=UPI0015F4DEAB|nr:hypothetical protein [Deefgea sp. CFH1-16]MBM5574847.1 hypothetical protein [Deefgea sp. CFH1-16]